MIWNSILDCVLRIQLCINMLAASIFRPRRLRVTAVASLCYAAKLRPHLGNTALLRHSQSRRCASSAATQTVPLTLRARLRGAYLIYDELLQTQRLITTTVTGAVLAVLGDAFTQVATTGWTSYDLYRGVGFGFFGATVTGPVNFVWLNLLNDAVNRLAPQGGMRAVVAKVTIQSAFFQPFVYVPLFFGFTAAFRGWSPQQARERIGAEYVGTLQSLWAFWTPICVFTFACLPVRQQAIFFSGVSLAWNAILSFLTYGGGVVAAVLEDQTASLPSAAAQATHPTADDSNPLASPDARETVAVGGPRTTWEALDRRGEAAAREGARRAVRPASAADECDATQPPPRMVRTPSGRWLPAHQPPMAILDNDANPPPKREALSDQRIIGFLLGPGLM